VTRDEIRAGLLRILGGIAPEADLESLRGDAALREELDLDSMDFLNFVTAIDEQMHVAIPEADYERLATLDGCLDYLLRARGLAKA
jgi:acyl carrier protein